MTAKEYLQEIRKLDLYINQKQTEFDTLYKLRGGAGGIDYAQERVQTSPDGQGFTKISDRLIDLQKEINQLIDQLCDLKKSVALTLKSLDTPYADILNKIYVEFKSISYISSETGLTRKYYSMLHEVALEKFKEKHNI